MRIRKDDLADNRITIRLTKDNLENFLQLSRNVGNMSATINLILTAYFKKNGKFTRVN